MEPSQVSAFRPGDRFEGFLLVRSAEQRTSANGSKYLDMTLCDTTGEINCKMWDGTVTVPPSGKVVKVRGTVQEYNGRVQFRVEKMRPAEESDSFRMDALMPCAPEKPEDMLREIRKTVDAFAWTDLKKIVHEMLNMAGDRLMYSPAAQKMHHAERSGLLHHTLSMLRAAKALLPLYPFLNADLLLAGVVVHDLSKVSEMIYDETGTVSDYSAEGLLMGHLAQGAVQVRLAAEHVQVTGEAVLLLMHMVLSHHEQPEFGSVRPPMFPEAEMLHFIDDMDAKMNEMERVYARTPRGAFSEKIFGLDRRIYHPRCPEEAQETCAPAQPPKDVPSRFEPREGWRLKSAQDSYSGLLGNP